MGNEEQKPQNYLDGIKDIIAVASGKGGVGKTTTAVNLALALAAEGETVGILDADIYGPNLPHMLGVDDRPVLSGPNTIRPIEAHGIQSISMGYLVDAEVPMIWRGPMVSQALLKLFSETAWQKLDYLIIDLPPGTGDVQLTLSQKIPVTGAVVVTTPQDVALLDARKGLEMFRKVNVPLLGIIENMALYTCSQCGHQESVFGEGGGERIAQQCDVELLGSLPLDITIRQDADAGTPIVVAHPDHPTAQRYRAIARRMLEVLSKMQCLDKAP